MENVELVYLIGELDDDKVRVDCATTCEMTSDDFFYKIKKLKDRYKKSLIYDEDLLELFIILGEENEIKRYTKIVRENILDNVENIENNIVELKKINIKNKRLEKFLNIFVKSVFFEDNIRFPYTKISKINDCDCAYFFSDINPEIDRSNFVLSVIEIWFMQAQPMKYGKTITTRTFLMSDLRNRRVISLQYEGITPYLILEGGIKLYLDQDKPYLREKVGFNDMPNIISLTDIENIVLNPIYFLGKNFEPYTLFIDWQKVFIYALAILPVSWDVDSVKKVYNEFVNFVKSNVCEMNEIEKMFENQESYFYKSLIVNIERVKKYLQGKDENVLSKDFLLMINTRYIYLEAIYKLLEKRFKNELREVLYSKKKLDLIELDKLILAVDSDNSYSKGLALEELADYIFSCIPGLIKTGNRVNTDR